ncbi:uncharacterized protein EHS24_006703 [Apiotrichum porosum]|uniref:N-acetyltransferase domain-containing protein n=1 Tax=Apiotrichum porosum TaxID=105984 RepID=A0A427Y222_9TREE|nr:uncharacterized protein EHS24_006703 [Apiotrichum porosum]RSH85110.1 hypothetical protein EHS24_006703 [Apiotrichum porosum]
MSIVRQTELTAATIDPAAEVYNAAFNVRTFYVIRAVWGDVPAEEVDPIQLLKLKQHVYRAICNHEVYGAYLDGSQAPAAIMVLKRPVDGNNPPNNKLPTPYDAELDAYFPPDAAAREQEASDPLLEDHTATLKKQSWKSQGTLNYHISYLATNPSAQRKGLASRLVRFALERAKSEGREVSLTTHSRENVDFYARLGFNVKGSAEWDIGNTPFTWWCLSTDMAKTGSGTDP